MIKTVTYNKIWFGDLERLIKDNLQVTFRGDCEDYENYDFDWPEDCYPFGQNTHVIIDPNTEPYKGDKLHEYVRQLIQKGILPTDHHIYIDIWW